MKCLKNIFLFSLIILFYSCNFNSKAKTQDQQALQVKKTEQQIKEEQEALRMIQCLQAKADTAKQYCIDKNFDTNYCMLVDMLVHSGKKRFFLWDFNKDTIAYSSLCCHGYGQGSNETNPVFSNILGSYCTSLGKYKTGARAYSKWGINIHYKLHGLETSNSNAFNRIVVLHSHSYVPDYEIYPNHLPLGYSQGCPVIDNYIMAILDEILKKTKKPILLWIYNGR